MLMKWTSQRAMNLNTVLALRALQLDAVATSDFVVVVGKNSESLTSDILT
jgi:hypothetical protein